MRVREYRRLVLEQLVRFGNEVGGPDAYLSLAPKSILGRPGDQGYVAAINELLEEGLILGVASPESEPAFPLNPAKRAEVETELRSSWYHRPVWQWAIGTAIGCSASSVWFCRSS